MSDVTALLQPLKDRLAAATDAVESIHFEAVAYADDIAEGGDVEVPEDYERHYCEEDGEDWPCRTVTAAPTDQAKLIAAIEAVAAPHQESFREVEPWAMGYKYSGHHCVEDGEAWPCDTIAALTQALGGDTA